MQGRAGAPCGCFGARGRVSRAERRPRAALLAVAFAVLPLLDRRPLTTDEWLAVGLGARARGRRRAGASRCSRWRASWARCGCRIDAAGRARDRQRGAGGRRAHRRWPRRFGGARPTAARAGRLHLRGLPHLPRARARGRRCSRATRGVAAALRRGRGRRRVGARRRARQPVRGGARRRRDRARQGHVQLGRAARVGARRRRAPPRGAQCLGRAPSRDARCAGRSTSRRGFLSRVGGGVMALAGAQTAGSLIKPGEAEAYHFCGHIYTTDSCPHPTGIPRIDSRGLPAAGQGRQAASTTSGAWSTAPAIPVDEDGQPLTDPDGRRAARARRARRCARPSAERYGFDTQVDGAWYRCCGGQRAQARRLLRALAQAHQRRRRADGLLLQGPQGLLRHVLPDEGARAEPRPSCSPRRLVAGVTGAWSPCGFSMVDTLAPHGYAGRLRTTLVACATFAAGALAGGVITFGGLALARAARWAHGGARRGRRGRAGGGGRRGARRADRPAGAPPGAGVVAAGAAAAAGRRPVRRAARARLHHLHPLLRGVGARGRAASRSAIPASGCWSASASALGRALPVVVARPAGRTERGAAAHAAMAERPAHPARAAGRRRGRAGRLRRGAVGGARRRPRPCSRCPRPTRASTPRLLAFQQPGAGGLLLDRAPRSAAPGPHPAVGGGRLAWRGRRHGRGPRARRSRLRRDDPAPARRRRRRRRRLGRLAHAAADDALLASPLAAAAPRRGPTSRARSSSGAPRSRATGCCSTSRARSASRIDRISLATGARTDAAQRAPRALLLNPSALGDQLLYVRSTYKRQQLRIGPLRRAVPRARPRALRHRPHRPPRRGPRARRRAPQARLSPEAPAAAQARRLGHAVEHRADARPPLSRGCGRTPASR